METLKNEIKNVIDSTDIGISIYTLLKNNEIRKLDIESESLNDLKKMFIDYINSEIISDQDKSVLKISSADERGNVIYEYDLDLTESFNCFSSLDENVPLFNAKHDSVTDIDALIIEIATIIKMSIVTPLRRAFLYFLRGFPKISIAHRKIQRKTLACFLFQLY